MLELRGISAGYETGLVVRDVDLVVPDRAVVALLGPNGAGKTTLLRVASGLLEPAAGQVLLDGVDVTGVSSDALARRGVCHVPEGRGVFRDLTVGENLRLLAPKAAQKDGMSRAIKAFPRLGDRLSQLAATMSGGEQQMLALSRAYLSEPRVLLLDEVSMGLAPLIVDEIFAHLRELATAGISLLLVEQYVHRALELADYTYVLRQGRIALVAEPGELDDEAVLESYMGV